MVPTACFFPTSGKCCAIPPAPLVRMTRNHACRLRFGTVPRHSGSSPLFRESLKFRTDRVVSRAFASSSQDERRSQKSVWREDVKVLLAVLALLAALGAFIEAERVKKILHERMDQIKDRLLRRNDIREIGLRWLQDTIRDPSTKAKLDEVIEELFAQHSGAVQAGLTKHLLEDKDFIASVVAWSKEQAVAVCQDPETIQAMTVLLQEAIEKPETLKAAQNVIDQLTHSGETEKMVKDFLVKTAADGNLQAELAKAGRGTLESLANDKHIQEALSTSLWNITRRALVPRWFGGPPESDQTVSAVKKLKRISREVTGKGVVNQGSSFIATPLASYDQSNITS